MYDDNVLLRCPGIQSAISCGSELFVCLARPIKMLVLSKYSQASKVLQNGAYAPNSATSPPRNSSAPFETQEHFDRTPT